MLKYSVLLFWVVSVFGAHAFTSHKKLPRSSRPAFQQQQQQYLSQLHQQDDSDKDALTSRGGSQLLLNRSNLLKAFAFAGGIAIVPLALEGYARIGSVQSALDTFQSSTSDGEISEGNGSITNDTRDITIIFHGAGGQDSNTDELLKVLRSGSAKTSFVKMVDWSQDSADILKASIKGSSIGKTLGNQLKVILQKQSESSSNSATETSTEIRNVHIIGISVGAFSANEMVQTLDSTLHPSLRRNIFLQLTLLDPFQQKAVLGFKYGKDNFGTGADYAQQLLNTDDPVPSTNDSLPYCATTDVTSLRPSEVFGHDWPLIYYTDELKGNGDAAASSLGFGMVPTKMRKKIGETIML
jgi:hypothetical protein